MSFIPQIEPWIDGTELKYLKKVIDSTYVTEHALTHEFEERIKDSTGSKYAISVCNGTAALFCCLRALGIGPGDEVIVPNLTFIATANAVILAGATPVFCDITRDTLSIDVAKAQECVSDKTKAIIPVHLYGFSADMDEVLSFATEHGISVVEDAAQGVGVSYKGNHVGTLGDLGILSFYGNKTMTCGEGGMILTDDPKLAEECYKLKNHGRSKKGVFVHESIGFNFCFTELQAAVGLAQLDKLPQIIEKKKAIHDRYIKELSSHMTPLVVPAHITPVYWFTSFLTSRKKDLQKFLLEREIQTREFFYPLDLQPCYNNTKKGEYPTSHALFNTGISLPSSYNLSSPQQEKVIQSVKDFYKCGS
tara:strand:- start:22 stop:1110 length:1089 start_codon:yes stop_codon:yes gene_type:complete